LHEQPVADGVTKTIVEDLEFVNVSEQNGELEARVPPRSDYGPFQAVKKKSTVRKTGQVVMEQLVLQPFLCAFSLRNVAVHDD
jgi:hypothetical protein